MSVDVLERVEIPAPQSARGRYGMAVMRYGIDSPQAVTARADLAEANIAAAIRDHLSGSPPLSEGAKARLVALLDG
jgi:hypothetical protein